jgi:hypothetical protein
MIKMIHHITIVRIFCLLRTLHAVLVRVDTSYRAAGPCFKAVPGLGSLDGLGKEWAPKFLGFEDVVAISGHQKGLSLTGGLLHSTEGFERPSPTRTG